MPFKRSIDNHTNSFQGLTRSVGKEGDSMKSPTYYAIYTQNSLETSQRPNAIHSIIASYGRATAAPVARIILLCTCLGFVVLHSQDSSSNCSSPVIKPGVLVALRYFVKSKGS